LTEQEVFVYLIHWIVHEMDQDDSTTIRYRVEEKTYQMKFFYHWRQMRVSAPLMISMDAQFTLYEWADEDTFNGITAQKIQESVQRADEKNYTQHGAQSEDCEIMKQLSTENYQELTAEDYNLIEEFLEGC